MTLTILDKYIIKQFIRNFLFSLLCFILVFILVDLFENLDRFIDNKFNFIRIANYYYYFTPEIIKLVTPVSMLLATLFTAGRMINFNELVAVKNAGVSLLRFMMPFFIVGALVTGLSIYFNNWIVPEANKKKFFIERNFLGKNIITVGLTRLYFQDSKNQLILIEQFKEVESSAKKVSILVYKPDNLTELVKRIDIEELKWENGRWKIINGIERTLNAESENLTNYSQIYADEVKGINKINLKPTDITKKQLKPDELNYGELKEFINSQVKGGQNVARAQVDFYSKISFPFSSLIVIIFGISISTGTKKRRSLAIQFGISMLTSFIYLGFVKFSHTFGYNGDLNPLITAWLANIIFATYGGVNLYIKNY
ncbi:MAG: LptF/LptG family permease [Ignavibacteria bacterium]